VMVGCEAVADAPKHRLGVRLMTPIFAQRMAARHWPIPPGG
jgi:hypothetical protein